MAGPKQYIFPVQLRHVENEILCGPIDGVNDIFTTINPYIDGTEQVYLNGLRQQEGLGNDYLRVSDDTIQMLNVPLPGDKIIADYIRKN